MDGTVPRRRGAPPDRARAQVTVGVASLASRCASPGPVRRGGVRTQARVGLNPVAHLVVVTVGGRGASRGRGEADTVMAPPAADHGGGRMGLELAPHLASIGRGRRWVAAEAVRCGCAETRVRVIQLLTSELIANAVLHGTPGGRVEVRVARSGDTFRVEVDDASSSSPRLLPVARDGPGGRGLALVERLADRWGYELREPDGKTVWFEVRVRRQMPGSTT